jgi:hypothetical protein
VRDGECEHDPKRRPPDVRGSEAGEAGVDPQCEQRPAHAEHQQEGLDRHVSDKRPRRRAGYAKIARVEARRWLEQLEQVDYDPSPGLALLAAHALNFDEDAVQAARRRALLLLAAGGDPHRELELDGRAAESMSSDLDSSDRRSELAAALAGLRAEAAGLPRVQVALGALMADAELAWRWVACALLAEELAEDA